MRRLLTVAVLGGLAWWGYGQFFGSEAVAKSQPPTTNDDSDPSGEFEDPPLRAEGAGGEAEQADDKVGRFLAALRGGDERSRQHAFAVYAKSKQGDSRHRIGAAIERLIAAAPTAAAVALLGDKNAFLHTELGRESLSVVLERVYEEPPTVALPLSTRVLDAAMQGPIERVDDAAREALEQAYQRHRNLVRRVVFDPGNAARARHHVVASGDSLDKIARRFRKSGLKVSSGTLAMVNRIDNPNALQIGRKLRVPIDPIRCVVRKASYTLATYVGRDLVRIYRIAHGKEGHETPETTFVVGETIANPDWHHQGRVIAFGEPENPLGRYFVKFGHESYGGFGAHGTNEPDSIGRMASLGCLRLLPEDIAEFARFVPAGTEIEVR